MSDRVDRVSNGSSTAQHRATILPLDRFNAFSDGVFAIAITLLVLEIAVPSLSAPLLTALQELWPDFLGYFISFSYIGGIWLSHAGLTRLMKQGDSTSYGLNLLMLIFVALLPFTTRLMVTHLAGPDVEIATVIYGLDVLLASLTLSLLIFHVARQPTSWSTISPKTRSRGYTAGVGSQSGVGAFAVLLAFVARSPRLPSILS